MTEKDMCASGCGGCGGGCGHDHEHEEEPILIDLDMEDGSKLTAEVIGVFEYEEREYIALVPVDDEEAAVMIYRFVALGEDEADLQTIESDEEFEAVQNAFMEMFYEDEE